MPCSCTGGPAPAIHRDLKPANVALAVVAGGDPQATPVEALRPRIPSPEVIPWIAPPPTRIALRSTFAVVAGAIARTALALLGAHVSGGAPRSREASARALAAEDRVSIVRARTTGRATPISRRQSRGAGVTVATPHELANDPSAELVVTALAPPPEGSFLAFGGRRGSVRGGRR